MQRADDSAFDAHTESVVGRSGVGKPESPELDLTAAQRAMWFAERLSGDYSVNIAQYLDITHDGSLDHGLLARCSIEAGQAMESPYLRILDVDGVPRQQVDLDLPIEVDTLDFRAHADPLGDAMAHMRSDHRRSVDLLGDLLVVSTLIRVADDRTFWYMRGHHIVIDGYAALTMIRMAVDRYNAIRRGEQLSEKPIATMAEIVADDVKYQASSRRETDGEHWRSRVVDLPERVTLSHRDENTDLRADNVVVGGTLPTELQERLVSVSAELNTSMAVTVTAAFGAFLSRMTGRDDVVLTLPVTGRASAKIKRGGGMVSNVLPIRLATDGDAGVTELIEQTQLELTGALRHQRYRSDDIWRASGVGDGSYAFGPVINMMFFDQPIALDGAEVEYHILTSGMLEDLLLNLYQASPGAPLVIDLHGNANRYDDAEMHDHHARFLLFLNGFLDAAVRENGLLADVALLTAADAERNAVQSGPVPAQSRLLTDVFAETVRTHEHVPAVTDVDGETLTYGQLDRRANQMARWLIEHGAGPEVLVALALPRSVDLLVAIWAVLKSGAAFVPVDPTHPADRIAHMIADSGVELGICGDTDAGLPDLPRPWLPLRHHTSAGRIAITPSSPLRADERPPLHVDNLAYVIYTSGSTGRPKGTPVTHRGVHNLGVEITRRVETPVGARVLGYASPSFDASIADIVQVTYAGATLVNRPVAALGGEDLADVMREQDITHASLTPTVLATLAPESVRGLHTVIVAGEAVGQALIDAWGGPGSRGEVELINGYGPTEASVGVSYTSPLRIGDRAHLGEPIAGTSFSVLDARMRPVPDGVAGELYLAGIGLSRGYLGRPGLTAGRFVANPFGAAGERLYRTGDLVRRSTGPDGRTVVEFVGRTDFQLKLRGQRIEPGEIEAVISSYPGVESSAVLGVDATGSVTTTAAVRVVELAAYVVAADDVSDEALQDFVAQRVPRYMVPALYTRIDAMPRTPTGKLDRRGLPDPETPPERAAVEYVAPRTELERHLVDAVAALIEMPADPADQGRIGMHDNLFRIGADSLTASRLASTLRRRLAVDVSLTDVFASADLADLAERIAAQGPSLDGPVDQDRPRQPRPDVLPLSHAQTRLWFVNRMEPGSPTYNMPGAVRFRSGVDIAAMSAALMDLLARHEPLRTRFPSRDGEPIQEILDVADVVADMPLQVERVQESAIGEIVGAQAHRGFDLTTQIPFRASMFELEDGSHVLVIVLHHIAGDGASMAPLIGDLLHAYHARTAGAEPSWPPLAIQYADYALEQRSALGDPDDPQSALAGHLDFWSAELSGLPELLAVPTDHSRPRIASGRGDYVDVDIDADLIGELSALAAANGVTLFTALHAGLAILLGRLAETDDVAIGTAIAGRDDPRVAGLIGMFVNTVVLRSNVEPAQSVNEFLVAGHRARAAAMDHSDVPFEQIVEHVAPSRSVSHAPLFQVAMTMQDDETGMLGAAGFDVHLLDARVPAAKFDLSFTAVRRPVGGQVELEISYATDLFDESTVRRMAGRLVTVLRAMVLRPHAPIGSIDVLDADEVAQVTALPRSLPARTFGEILATGASAAAASDRAISGASTMTRAVFEARTNQIARELIGRGVGPGQVVAIAIARSEYSVLATVAVVKTGAAFVNIDPRYPVERRAAMLADSAAAFGLCVSSTRTEGADDDLPWLAIDEPTTELQVAGHSGTPLRAGELTRPVAVDDLAYLIYTSGSTGRPKAAAVSHRGLANMVANQIAVLGLTRNARVLHVASPSFDASVFELLMAAASGAELVVCPADVYAGTELEKLIAEHRVTHAVMTPSALATLDPAAVATLRTVISAGEACPPELVRRWVGGEHRRFFNLYGPTEATIWATAAGPISADDDVTIGHALDGVGAYVLDSCLRPVADGVPGELYLSGDQLAIGYHHRADLTASAFVANPYADGARMYRTGDRVTRTSSGELIYHGRTDFQLKIRGLRIEPGEVDAVLRDHSSVANALSLGVEGPAGETILVAYVTAESDATVHPDQLTAHVGKHLPQYMVPHTICVIDSFSMTPVGKVDRSALPDIDFSVSRDFIAPRTQLEAVIADVFAQVLDMDRVSVRDGFFELGGNSLSATKLAARLSSVLDRRIAVREIFEAPTPAGLADLVSDSMAATTTPPLVARNRAEMVPVSTVQRGMWLVNRADPDSPVYNVAMALRLVGEVDFTALRAAVVDLIGRHESLRTTYPMINGEPIQVIVPPEVIAAELDLAATPVTGPVADAIAAVTGEGFDVTTKPPVRLAILEVEPTEHILLFVVHHISADGASMAPLARDLMTAYAGHLAGTGPRWRPLDIQYADFSLWQADKLNAESNGITEGQRQLDYWKKRLAGAPTTIDIPTDLPRPPTPSFDGARVEFEISGQLARSLQAVARTQNTTLFMVTHAAFAVLLARLSGRNDVVVGTPYAGRGELSLESIVGMFVNTLALRTQLRPDEPFTAMLERVRGEDLSDMANADIAFDQIVSAVVDTQASSHNPLFQVMFAFQNIEFPMLELDGLRVTPIDEQLIPAKVDLQLTLFPDSPYADDVTDGAMRGEFVYATDLFTEDTVSLLAQRYLRVLEAIAADPGCIVGDIVIHTADELAGAVPSQPESSATAVASLSDLVATAAAAAPNAQAVHREGVSTTFGELGAMMTAMMAVLPDPDAALTTALVAGIPGLAAGGPELLDDVLGELRDRATAAVDAPTGRPASGSVHHT